MHYFFAIFIAISTFRIVTGVCPTKCKVGQTCDAADSGCPECEQSYFGRHCQHRLECTLTDKGADYRGKRNTTQSGRTCQRWDTNTPHGNLVKSPILEENYCRNLDGEPRPWCYTTDPGYRWDLCIVPSCNNQCLSPTLSSSGVDVTNPPPDGFVFGFAANIGCMVGYEASTQPKVATITCQNDKTWTDLTLPTCRKVQCSSPEQPNSKITNPKSNYEYQDSVTIECDTGYTLQGQSTLTCQADKSWGPSLSTCNINECPAPVTISNSNMSDAKAKYVYQDIFTVKCNIGYTLQGQEKIQCQADKTWTALPTCEKVQCPLPAQANSRIMNPKSKYEYQDKVTLVCDTGYTLQGQDSLTCQADKSWGPSLPTCKNNECPAPMTVPNSAMVDTKDKYVYQDTVIIICDTGYVLQGQKKIHCQADKTWTATPTCGKVKCPQPSVKANSKISDLKPEYEYQDSVTIVCDAGYFLQGHNNLTCQADASWDPSVPICSSYDCYPPKLNNNSKMTVTKTTFQRGDIVEFLCETGFILHGPTQLTCLGNWTWDMEPPICKIVECPLPSLPGTTTLLNPKHTYFYGDYITFICTEGHEFHGGNTSVCKDTAQWSEPFPLCKKINCTGLKLSSNILISSPKKYTYSYNDKVSFHCDEGFKLSHDNDLVCQANKLWDKEEPFCIEICSGLSTSMWVGITVGLNLANTLLTILIMCRCRLRDKTNNTPPVSAINTKNAAFDDYDSIDVNKKDEQNIYNVPE